MEADSRERLQVRVAECDDVLAEDGDSPDPVARRRVIGALQAKARALEQLGSHEECAQVWEEIGSRFAEEPPAGDSLVIARVLLNKGLALRRAGRDQDAVVTLDEVVQRCVAQDGEKAQQLVIRALSAKALALMRLRGYEAASDVDEQIIRSFAAAADPSVRVRVAFALVRRAAWLLREHRVDDALEISNQLLARFRAEADPEARKQVGEVLLTHARSLLAVGSLSLDSYAISLLVMLAGAVGEAAGVAGQRLRLDRFPGHEWLRRSAPLSEIGRAAVQRAPLATFSARRKRAAQAHLVCEAVLDCFGTATEPDEERIAVTAKMYAGASAALLGHIVEGFRSFDALVGSGQETAAEAFRAQAARVASERGLLAEFGTVSNLAHRARTLGQGDPRITRIAYEESLRTDGPASRTGRLIARLLAPGKN